MSYQPTIAHMAVRFAREHVGAEYEWLGEGPKFDCSGLIVAAFRLASHAKHVPYHNSYRQYRDTERIERSSLIPGDLAFYYPQITHVAMYVGRWRDHLGIMRRWVVQATDTKRGVELIRMNAYAVPIEFGRYSWQDELAP